MTVRQDCGLWCHSTLKWSIGSPLWVSKSATVSTGSCAAETCTALTHFRRDKSPNQYQGWSQRAQIGTACHGSARACRSTRTLPRCRCKTAIIRGGTKLSSEVLSRSLYRSHVLTTFLGPVLGPWWSRFVGILHVTVFWCWPSWGHHGEQDRTEVGSKAPPAVAKSTPKAANLRCAFSHSAERIVDELGLLYPENRGNLRKNMASV